MTTAEPDAPLGGLRVLLTRPPERTRSLCARIERELGAAVDSRSPIALVPPDDPAPARRALDRLDTFAWIVFTSANGVRAFRRMLGYGTAGGGAGRIAAIGAATAAVLAEHGLATDLVAGDSRSEGLAAALGERIAPGDSVLLVQPEQTRGVLAEELGARGARVTATAFYRNVVSSGARELAADVALGRYDVLVFTAPSTVRRLLEAGVAAGVDAASGAARARRVAIGSATAEALAEEGLAADAVAREPGDSGLLEALRRLPIDR